MSITADFVPFTGSSGPVRLTVVGGTTPFACEFISDLGAVDPGSVTWDLRLLGRRPESVAVLADFAAASVTKPHHVFVTADPAQALDGADIVLVQPRVGGFPGRAEDEDLAAAVGAPADEGLGPGGLRSALRSAPVLRGLAADLLRRSPQSLVLGFSNPLSTTVALLAESGLRAAGTCELPDVTAAEIAARLEVATGDLNWAFTGLNHRGFLHDLTLEGEPVLQRLVATLRSSHVPQIGGISANDIADIGAVPLKYHAMLSGATVPPSGRARELQRIRTTALDELRQRPWEVPTALAHRSMPWYRQAVLPILLALSGARPAQRMVIDVPCADGLVRERHCRIDVSGIATEPTMTPAPIRAQGWIQRFEAHERALTALLADPNADHLLQVLQLDPATPDSAIPVLLRVLSGHVSALRDQPVQREWWSA